MSPATPASDDVVAPSASFKIKLAGFVAPGAFNALGALNMLFRNQVIGARAPGSVNSQISP